MRCTKAQWRARGGSFITMLAERDSEPTGQMCRGQRQAAVVIYMMYSPTEPRGCRMPGGPWPIVSCPQLPLAP